jgi:thiol-disulfide isomerase/thioredoxin
MSGLLFLTSSDFSITKGTKGNILCHGIQGYSFILFYSTQCEYCHTLIPIIKKLPGTIVGVQFGMINVSSNKTCIQMSQNTISHITYVPLCILYINGKPFMKYSGPADPNEIRRFIIEVSTKIQNKQKFSEETVKDNGKELPAYCIGHPLCGTEDNVCYIKFSDYGTDNTKKQSR